MRISYETAKILELRGIKCLENAVKALEKDVLKNQKNIQFYVFVAAQKSLSCIILSSPMMKCSWNNNAWCLDWIC